MRGDLGESVRPQDEWKYKGPPGEPGYRGRPGEDVYIENDYEASPGPKL